MSDDPFDPMVLLAKAMERLADSIDHLAVASQAISPGGPTASAHHPPPIVGAPSGPPGGQPQKTSQEKKAAKVFVVCKNNGWDIADIGARVLGRPVSGNSKQWSEGDLNAVLDAFKEWGVG